MVASIIISKPMMNRFPAIEKCPFKWSPFKSTPKSKKYDEAIDHDANTSTAHSFQAFGRTTAAKAVTSTSAPTIKESLKIATSPKVLGIINGATTNQVPSNRVPMSCQCLFMIRLLPNMTVQFNSEHELRCTNRFFHRVIEPTAFLRSAM